ncbi:MAG: amino acid racemase [Bacteroidales bacterium]|nr:amino acid racemase [Bacteroidales bacterium]
MNFAGDAPNGFMEDNKFRTIGILGGMGPEATLSLFAQIIKATPAKKDQDHIPVIIFNNPSIPDRTRHIVYKEESPLPYLVAGAHKLEQSGADMILIPCNTAHFYVPEMEKSVGIPILNMPRLTCDHIAQIAKLPGESLQEKRIPVGILATTGTIHTGLYQGFMDKNGLCPLLPTEEEQESLVMEAVYGKEGVKAGYHQKPANLLAEAAAILASRGAGYIIAGCTEIPLVLSQQMVGVPLVNSMEVLARKAVHVASNGLYG